MHYCSFFCYQFFIASSFALSIISSYHLSVLQYFAFLLFSSSPEPKEPPTLKYPQVTAPSQFPPISAKNTRAVDGEGVKDPGDWADAVHSGKDPVGSNALCAACRCALGTEGADALLAKFAAPVIVAPVRTLASVRRVIVDSVALAAVALRRHALAGQTLVVAGLAVRHHRRRFEKPRRAPARRRVRAHALAAQAARARLLTRVAVRLARFLEGAVNWEHFVG